MNKWIKRKIQRLDILSHIQMHLSDNYKHKTPQELINWLNESLHLLDSVPTTECNEIVQKLSKLLSNISAILSGGPGLLTWTISCILIHTCSINI